MSNIVSLIRDDRCQVCGAVLNDESVVCADCRQYIKAPKDTCIHCGLELNKSSHSSFRCGLCIQRPPAYTQLSACSQWNEVIQILVHKMKFGKQLACARFLGRLLAHSLPARDNPQENALVPVPLSKRRLFQRGFNQAEEMAGWCQRLNRGKLVDIGAHRRRHTQAQSQLKLNERKRNIRGCFSVPDRRESYPRQLIIIDDLVTTTHTVGEFTRTLNRAGYRVLGVWCISRVPPDSLSRLL